MTWSQAAANVERALRLLLDQNDGQFTKSRTRSAPKKLSPESVRCLDASCMTRNAVCDNAVGGE